MLHVHLVITKSFIVSKTILLSWSLLLPIIKRFSLLKSLAIAWVLIWNSSKTAICASNPRWLFDWHHCMFLDWRLWSKLRILLIDLSLLNPLIKFLFWHFLFLFLNSLKIYRQELPLTSPHLLFTPTQHFLQPLPIHFSW